jgi:hypothetical protein
MNAERLHAVARAVKRELDEMQIVAILNRLRQGLEEQVNAPAEPGPQQQVSTARQELASALSAAPSNTWPVADQQLVEELGISDVLGSRLFQRIDAILARNEITPTVARDEIIPIHDRLTQVDQHLASLFSAFDFFSIGAEELPDSDCEVSFSIPRPAVRDELNALGDEFVALRRILGPFQELVLGSRPGVEVRSISSSDFGIYLLAAPAWAFGLAKAVQVIVDTYKSILEIRLHRHELSDLGVPDSALANLDGHANTVMSERLGTLTAELVNDVLPINASVDPGRKNELTIELRISLNKIANRIDQGYGIDVRAPDVAEEPEPTEEGASPDPEELQRAEYYKGIRDAAPTLRFLKVEGDPILSLPESSTPEEPKKATPTKKSAPVKKTAPPS